MLTINVSLILRECGIAADLKGYSRLRTAILLAVEDPSKLDGVTKRLYPAVPKVHNEHYVVTERNMRYAIECAFDHCDAEVIKRYAGHCQNKNTGGVSVSEFIGGIVDFINIYMLDAKDGIRCLFDGDKPGIFRGWVPPTRDGEQNAVVQNELGWLRLVPYNCIKIIDKETAL